MRGLGLESRGGLASGQRLLRYANGQPISARRYDYLWQRLGRHRPWVATQQVSMHWIRHTVLTWVERHFGFAVAQARIVNAQPVGTDHVRCILTGPDGTGRLKAIAFRAAGTPVGEALLAARGLPLHLAGQPGEERRQVAGGGCRERPVHGDLAGSVGNMDDLGGRHAVPAAELAVAKPEVQRRADHDDQVRRAEGQ